MNDEPPQAVIDEAVQVFGGLSIVGRLRFVVGMWLFKFALWVLPIGLEAFERVGLTAQATIEHIEDLQRQIEEQ